MRRREVITLFGGMAATCRVLATTLKRLTFKSTKIVTLAFALILSSQLRAQQQNSNGLFLEGWGLTLPDFAAPIDTTHPILNMWQGYWYYEAESLKQVVKAAHLFLEIRDGSCFAVHGFPFNGTHKTEKNEPTAQLKVVVITCETSETYRQRFSHPILPERQLDIFGSLTEVFGRVLDMGAAINNANIPYRAVRLSAKHPPTNSNAAAAAELYTFGFCSQNRCPNLDTIYPGYPVPGVNAGLATFANLGTAFADMARLGATTPVLAKAYIEAFPLDPNR
jgi:hypothetical protein